MNKEEVLNTLAKKLNISLDETKKINKIFENNFILDTKSKDKIITELESKLHISKDKAEKIYETFMDVLDSGVKNKILNPLKDLLKK